MTNIIKQTAGSPILCMSKQQLCITHAAGKKVEMDLGMKEDEVLSEIIYWHLGQKLDLILY